MGAISTNGDRQPFVTIIARFLDFGEIILYIFLAQALRRQKVTVRPEGLSRLRCRDELKNLSKANNYKMEMQN